MEPTAPLRHSTGSAESEHLVLLGRGSSEKQLGDEDLATQSRRLRGPRLQLASYRSGELKAWFPPQADGLETGVRI